MSKVSPGHAETTTRTTLDRKSTGLATFRVHVVEGGDTGKSLTLGADTPGAVLVGSGPACELVLDDRRISRRHLSLENQANRLRMLDLGSMNGTVVHGIAIQDAFLRGGERIQIGETTLVAELVSEAQVTALWPVESFGRLLGRSVAMRRLYPLLQKLAASTLPLVIEGETGSGKELLAESLHEMGPRKKHPFVVFDCAAASGALVEIVLFGAEERDGKKMTITRRGVFEEAHRGTLLLDEVGELSPVLQAKLLRVLERGEICRVGGDSWVKTDVRILATTRRNLDRDIELGKFREELFFRLAAARVALPPLRDRGEDVAFLGECFWAAAAPERTVPPDLVSSFEAYAWPGNVRELAHVVARKLSLGDLYPNQANLPVVDLSSDTKVFERVFALNLALPEARARVVAEFERYFVERILARHDGNVSHAAAASGIARRYFQILKTRSR